jgi:hypothetical protein
MRLFVTEPAERYQIPEPMRPAQRHRLPMMHVQEHAAHAANRTAPVVERPPRLSDELPAPIPIADAAPHGGGQERRPEAAQDHRARQKWWRMRISEVGERLDIEFFIK